MTFVPKLRKVSERVPGNPENHFTFPLPQKLSALIVDSEIETLSQKHKDFQK